MYQDILTSLPSLSRAQLEEIRRRASFLLQNKGKGETATEENEDWLLEGIFYELERRGIADRKSTGFRIKNSSSFAGYETRATEVRTLLERAAPGMSTVEYRALGQVAARELANYIKTDISLNKMLSMASLVPQAVAKAFPGYMESKMLGIIIRKKI